jgi:hypothetical protein
VQGRIRICKIHFDGMWSYLRRDCIKSSLDNAKEIKKAATLLVCEAIQVAAMADKYVKSFKEEK